MRKPEEQTMTEVIAILHDQPFSSFFDIVRNVRTLTRRCSNEGMSFFTKFLPSVGKRFDSALSGNSAFSIVGLLKKSGNTCFPHFLGSALKRVFDNVGFLLVEPCYATVRWLRTLFYYSYKIEIPFSEDVIDSSVEEFVSVDDELINIHRNIPDGMIKRMKHQWSFLDEIPLCAPTHGPGASSNVRRDEKWDVYVPPSRLRGEFGRAFFMHFLYLIQEENFLFFLSTFFAAFVFVAESSNNDFLAEKLGSLFEPYAIKPSKLTLVPKDSRGPRLICIEDSRMMYAQKSLQKSAYRAIEESSAFGGRINFTDQSINQLKTFDKSFATLDLKQASDRVSNALVKMLMPTNFARSAQACRSSHVSLPDGSLKELWKFAPMGSALCFPVLALLAYSSVTTFISMKHGIPSKDIEIYVYGDDIIVKNEFAQDAISALNMVGLVVNEGKSFVNSRFTESCGADTLDNVSVVPLRKKRMESVYTEDVYRGKRVFHDGGYLIHHVSLFNRSANYGYKSLSRALKKNIEKNKPRQVKICYGVESSSYLNWNVEPHLVRSYNQAEGYERDGKLKCTVYRDKNIRMDISSEQQLHRALLQGGGEKPLNSTALGARSPYLQNKTLIPWGLSYQ